MGDLKVSTDFMETRASQAHGSGLAPDARLSMDGFRNVLAIRAEMENMWGGKPPAPDKYLDLSYYERALRQAK